MLAKKESPASSAPQRETKQSGDGGAGLDKEKDPQIRPLVEQDTESLQWMLRDIPPWVKNPDYDRLVFWHGRIRMY
ncbi:hypothetical protein LWI29_035658 [Acer saccharum]|uniref:Uncharacterized protein n=1 Tax=Acer saccharum TaxID=4024 RepID=A0AA39S6M7_ACESA|nr:hypothetical protein LWI29_035658 [Acer saccharum]